MVNRFVEVVGFTLLVLMTIATTFSLLSYHRVSQLQEQMAAMRAQVQQPVAAPPQPQPQDVAPPPAAPATQTAASSQAAAVDTQPVPQEPPAPAEPKAAVKPSEPSPSARSEAAPVPQPAEPPPPTPDPELSLPPLVVATATRSKPQAAPEPASSPPPPPPAQVQTPPQPQPKPQTQPPAAPDPQPITPAFPPEWEQYGPAVQHVILQLFNGQYDQLRTQFSPTLAENLSATDVAEYMDDIRKKYGSFAEILDAHLAEGQTADLKTFRVLVKTTTKDQLLFSISLTPQKQIHGLLFRPVGESGN